MIRVDVYQVLLQIVIFEKNSRMMKYIMMVVVVLLATGISPAQESLISRNPITLPFDVCSSNTIEKMLRKHKDVKFDDMQIQELRLEIWNRNAQIDKEQQELINRRNHLIGIRQKITQLGNPDLIQIRIKEKQNAIEKIRNDIRTNLAGLGYKGIYVFACKTSSSYDTEKSLHEQAMKFMTPLSVEKTNGSYIASVTELRKKEGYEDSLYRYITEVVQGTSNVEAEIINKLNRKDGYYIFVAKLNTKPLQKEVNPVKSDNSPSPEYVVIFDALRDKNMNKKIMEVGAGKDDVKNLEQEIAKWRDLVAAENNRIREIEKDFILSGNQKILQINEEIKALQLEYDLTVSEITGLMTVYSPNIIFNKASAETSIREAVAAIDQSIAELETAIMEKEAERLYADYQILVTTSGDYFTKLSEECMASKDRLTEMYATVDHYVKLVEMENDNYRKTIGNDQVYVKYFDKIWVYPEPGEGDFFRLTVVVKFSLRKTKPSWKFWD